MTPGNPLDWSALVDEHDQFTPEERRQHRHARVYDGDPELRVRTSAPATIASGSISNPTPALPTCQRGAEGRETAPPPQREECLHGVPYRYPCEICDAGTPIRDQPPPVPSDRPSILGLVIADFRERERVGIERYGTPLQAHNGRDAMVDLYQELQDACAYIRQKIEERTDDTLAERARIHQLALDEAKRGPSGPCCSETRRRALLDFAALIAPPEKGD